MANTFNRKLSRNVGTSLTAVGSYTVGSSTKTVVVGLTLSNVSGSSINVDATVQMIITSSRTHLSQQVVRW
jgi:hypothetical protein